MIFSGPAHASPPSSSPTEIDTSEKRRLITDCVTLLRWRSSSSPSSSSMSTRGIDLIELLLDHAAATTTTTTAAAKATPDSAIMGTAAGAEHSSDANDGDPDGRGDAARGSPPDLSAAVAVSGVRCRGRRGIDLQAIACHLASSRRSAAASNGAAAASAVVPSFVEKGGAAADTGIPAMDGLDFDLGELEAWVQYNLDIPPLVY
jgi:hypothetical protein